MKRGWMLAAAVIVLLIGAFPHFGQGAQTKEGVLKVVIIQEPLTLELSQNNNAFDKIVAENWSEYLLNREPSGKVVPGVASWKMAPDGKKMECTLRKGVKFHSGDLLTAKDVLFGYERGKQKSRTIKSTLMPVERIEIIDDYHFNIHFKKPDILFLQNLTNIPIISKSYYDRVGEDVFTRQPSGTGPYKFIRYVPGEYVDIERFEEYWGKRPPVKSARIYFVSEGMTRIAKLKAGEVDIISGIPFTAVKELGNSPDFKLVKLEINHPKKSIMFGANKQAPWQDKRVRLAMAHAIDHKSIIDNVLFGIPNRYPTLVPGDLGYDPDLNYPYDPKKARALLAEAGYPNGFDLKFYWEMGGRVPMSAETIQAVASYFEAVGIRPKLIGEESAAIAARRNALLKPDADFIVYYGAGFTGGGDPVEALNSYFSADGRSPVFTNPEITKLIREARSTIEDSKRATLIKKVVKMIHEEVGIIPIVSNVSVYAMKRNIDINPTKTPTIDTMLVRDMAFK